MDRHISGPSSFTHHQLPALCSFQTTVQLVCLSHSHSSLQALWRMAVRLLSIWSRRNSHHQTQLYLSHTASQQEWGDRHPKVSSGKILSLPPGAEKPAESPRLVWHGYRRQRRSGGLGWEKQKLGLRRRSVIHHFPHKADIQQRWHEASQSPRRVPSSSASQDSWHGRPGIRTTGLIPSNHLLKSGMFNSRARITSCNRVAVVT